MRLKPYDETTDAGRFARELVLCLLVPFIVVLLVALWPFVLLVDWYFERNRR